MNKISCARWITCPGLAENVPVTFYARKRLSITSKPSDCNLLVSADCRFVLYVNGELVGKGPVRGSTTLQYLESFDLSKYLLCGENELFFEVYSLQEENFVVHSVAPALIAELPGIVATDCSWEVQQARAWRSDVPYFTPQSGRMEFRDYRIEADSDAWVTAELSECEDLLNKKLCINPLPAFEDVYCMPVEVLTAFELPEKLPELPKAIAVQLGTEQHLELDCERVDGLGNLLSGEGVCTLFPGENAIGMVLDFGNEVSGRMELEINAPAGTAVQVLYGEMLTGKRLANRVYPNYYFSDCFILREGENTVTTAFADRGFRMLQIMVRNFERPVVIKKISGVNRRYPFSKRGSFFSSDCRLNRIYDVCEETLSACSSDVFMDCPWRERAFWVNDLLVNNLAALHCFGASALHKHCLEMVFSQPHYSGLVSAVVPKPAMAGQPDFIFAPTNLYMILMLKDYYLYSGDRETVRNFLADIERILDKMWLLRDEDGILRTQDVTAKWNFYDWSFEENSLSCNGAEESMLSSLFIIAAKEFMALADTLDWTFDSSELDRRWQQIAGNFERRFIKNGRIEEKLLDTKTMTPKACSTQLAHALWLLTGEASEETVKICRDALVDPELLMPDYYLHYFWFRAAAITGNKREALSRIRRYWGRCIDTGSPTLYEAGIHTFGKQAMNGAGSLCHGFGTVPVAFMHEVILGVKPLSGGCKEFLFDPELLDLEFAEGRIAVPSGAIHVRVTADSKEITVPLNCTAILPDGTKLNSGHHILF